VDEGLMRDAEYRMRRGGSHGGMETLEAAVPGRGAAREQHGGLRSMTPITLSSSTFVGTKRIRNIEIRIH